jgi:hypothetical protein
MGIVARTGEYELSGGREDLLVGGAHASATADCRSKLQRKLTRKTLADHAKGADERFCSII